MVWNMMQMFHATSVIEVLTSQDKLLWRHQCSFPFSQNEMKFIIMLWDRERQTCFYILALYVRPAKADISALPSSNISPCGRAYSLQPSTSARLRQDGSFLNSCGDFVTWSCCRGNMSHLRSTLVGSSSGPQLGCHPLVGFLKMLRIREKEER